MPDSRVTSILRGLAGRCPRCRSPRVFASRYGLRACCPDCGLPLEQEDGWSLGAIPLNYAFTCLAWILPVALAFACGAVSLQAALLLAGGGAVVIPVLTYRRSKSLWVGVYYAVLPRELESAPAAKKGAPGSPDAP